MSDGNSTSAPAVEYRDIPGFSGYKAGSDGSVWSSVRTVRLPGRREGFGRATDAEWKKLKPARGTNGYHGVCIRPDATGKAKRQLVHRLVLLAFIGPPLPRQQGLHGDGDRSNNRIDNLRWGTSEENEADKKRHGTDNRIGGAKLTPAMVAEIRAKAATSPSKKSLASEYGITRSNLWHILKGNTWKDF